MIPREIERLERRGVLASRRVSFELRKKVIAAYDRGEFFDIENYIIREMLEILRDAMLATHLKGMIIAKNKASRKVVKAGVFDSVLNALKKISDTNLVRRLQRQYENEVVNVLSRFSSKIEKGLRPVISGLISEGAHIGQARKSLLESFTSLGLTPKNSYELETLYRTQTQISYGAGQWQSYQDPDLDEIIWGYEYSAIGDDRVRPEHLALDGTTLPKDHPMWQRIWPPNGWNCRCTVIPVFEAPKRVKLPGELGLPDEGFAYNPGLIFS